MVQEPAALQANEQNQPNFRWQKSKDRGEHDGRANTTIELRCLCLFPLRDLVTMANNFGPLPLAFPVRQRLKSAARRGGRVVEGARLESV
jgi:hypothetical protein